MAFSCRFSWLILVACGVILECNGLKCRLDGGPKEMELKKVFMECVRKLDGRSGNDSTRGTGQNPKQTFGGTGREQNYGDESNKNGHRRKDDGGGMGDERMGEYPSYNYRGASSNPRRYRRETRADSRSTGHRSQYNPNRSDKRPGGLAEDSSRMDNGTDSNMAPSDNVKGCVVHCFLQELQMTGENEMPDRYMVSHAITKNVNNEDLKDFLQESVEECFQLINNENIKDKCDFSKNLMICLSEKGRSNCDDWKEDGLGF